MTTNYDMPKNFVFFKNFLSNHKYFLTNKLINLRGVVYESN